jgi:hypothetical protein
MRQSGCCSRSRASNRATVVVLPVPGPPGEDADARQGAHRRCQLLVSIVGLGEQPLQPGGEHFGIEVIGPVGAPLEQLARDLALLVPVTGEPEARLPSAAPAHRRR